MNEKEKYKRSPNVMKMTRHFNNLSNYFKRLIVETENLGERQAIINRMLEINIVQNFSNIQIQFHEWYPSYNQSKQLRNSIQNKLSKTHELTYCYPFVWENWKLRIH